MRPAELISVGARKGCTGLSFDYDGFGTQTRDPDAAMCIEKADTTELVGFWEATFFILRANRGGAAQVWRDQFRHWQATQVNPQQETAFFAGYAPPACLGQTGHREIWQLQNVSDGARIEVSFFVSAHGECVGALMVATRDDDPDAADSARRVLNRLELVTGSASAGDEFTGQDDPQNARYVITPLAAGGGLP